MFVTLPPMIQVLMLSPRCGRWFIDLTWVRLLTRRRKQQRRGSSMDVPLALSTRLEGYDDGTKKEALLNADEGYNAQLMSENS
jgi:hypothetical protein